MTNKVIIALDYEKKPMPWHWLISLIRKPVV
ncbi:Uncharacterised protein [Aggregatibacter aphrophilus]|uniref:Uncharacterized protein n=1 Tax=Aggregatibacter aphrophilus TaxID=732 RepID=A0A336NAD6_AGGAP|nr:Uncharacterised protein [Aggregatibacter aphrophilus]